MECSICGISGRMRSVFEVISPKGVVLACEKCVLEEGFPILKKPDKKVFEESERKGTVYERMTRLSGVKPREPEKPELKRQEKSLREIVDRNYEEKIKKQDLSLKSRPDLVDKFHWIIMRVRRVKGLTQKQLAEAINETEAAIKMAEQGIVPEGYALIDKLERSLRVKLIKERWSNLGQSRDKTSPTFGQSRDKTSFNTGQTKEKDTNRVSLPSKHQVQEHLMPEKALRFDRKNLDTLTISDLQRIKKEREKEKETLKMVEDEEQTEEKDEP